MKNIDLASILLNNESETLEFKAVLPPARTLAQLICGFANAKGGTVLLGVVEFNGKIEVNGLSEDFRANTIVHNSIDLLSPKPTLNYQYSNYKDKSVYIIQIDKSTLTISVENKTYVRQGTKTILSNPVLSNFNSSTYVRLIDLLAILDGYQNNCTGAMSKFIDHYKSIANIIADLEAILYPESTSSPTNSSEGKILIRILFSSCADNFEIYLSDLLYEIFLAKPETLKSGQQVSVKEVLDCSDIQEFISYYAKQKLNKLQRGSVKGFIAENSQIRNLNVIDSDQVEEIERILQIRHLYAHKNGIVDEKFLVHFPNQFLLNDSHEMSIDSFLDYFTFLFDIVYKIDRAGIKEYNLAVL